MNPPPIALAGGPYRAWLDPSCGGSLAALKWHGRDLLRPQRGGGVLASASFPLVPFCNRIAGSAFACGGRTIALSPNHPEAPGEPVLHGFGWLNRWAAERLAGDAARLAWRHERGEWPWRFETVQDVGLGDEGAVLRLAATNLDDTPMPVGLGFHPYFPRSGVSLYRGLHLAERQPGGTLLRAADPRDWWDGADVGTRLVDTTYAWRQGPLAIEWPRERLGLILDPSDELAFTHVYVPPGGTAFCVEPVSHLPEAFHSQAPADGWRVLAPGERMTVSLRLAAYSLDGP
ncbi:MAG: hypothetical protein ACEQR8_04325 [Cypionkella sp.]